jgi:membrane fusion protein, multidrug efflux system
VSQDPIHVTFPVGQRQLQAHRDEYGDPVVKVTLPDGTLYQHPGKLNFLDIRADAGTDMVTVRAELPNQGRLLVDGQFVGVRVERGAPELRLTVPQAAIQDDHAGPYLLVVGNDGKVETRRVRLGAMEGGNVLVYDGLNAGERVIVEGLQRVRPGMVVAVSGSAAMPAGPTGTCAKPGIGCSDEPLAMRERAR